MKVRSLLALIVAVSGTLVACGDGDDASTTMPPTSTQTTPASTTSSAPATTVPPATTQPTTTEPAPTTEPATSQPGTTQPVETIELSVYFVRDERVALAHRTVPHTVATTAAALEQLLGGPTPEEATLGMSTAVPAETSLVRASISNRIAAVDLGSDFGSGGGSLSMRLRLAQVVYTVTQFPTVDAVVFELDGQPVTVFGSEGLVLDQPLTRADFEDETPAIFVDQPAPFDRVGPQLRVSGTANVFEATFMVRVVDSAGATVSEHFQMATSGTGTRGTFDFTVDVATAAHGTAMLRLWEPSSKDGSDTNVVEIPIEL
ncbi:MAG: Gmad2 immunoglobulin-like domain-containing protein [Ilumatobacteraceae bacterium]